MLKSALLRALLLLGIAVNVAFLLINLSPERPHLRARRRARIILRASPVVSRWVRENELAEFGAEHDLDFEVITLPTFEDVHQALRKELKEPSGVLLANLDDEHADEIREEGLVRAVEDLVPPNELPELMSELIPEASARSQGPDRKLWFLPKRAAVDVTGYLVPAVEDAYLHWEQDRPAIDAALKEANGFGLPRGYQLEKSPTQWDDYDIFVAGYYWAHHPAPWAATQVNGDELTKPAPRLAWRTGGSDEATRDLFVSLWRHGLRERDLGKVDVPAVLDSLQWAALFHKHGLIAKECESSIGCDETSVAGLLRSRRIAWGPIDQEDSLWIHGGARRDAAWAMEGARDLSWSARPIGVSVELKPDGTPARVGKTHSFLSMYFWAIPAKSKRPKLGIQLARFLLQRGLQQREAEALGMLPIRQDLRDQYPIYFRLDWMQQLLDASYRQIYRGSSQLPADIDDKDYDQLYAQVQEALTELPPERTPVSRAAVREAALRAAASFKPEVAHGE